MKHSPLLLRVVSIALIGSLLHIPASAFERLPNFHENVFTASALSARGLLNEDLWSTPTAHKSRARLIFRPIIYVIRLFAQKPLGPAPIPRAPDTSSIRYATDEDMLYSQKGNPLTAEKFTVNNFNYLIRFLRWLNADGYARFRSEDEARHAAEELTEDKNTYRLSLVHFIPEAEREKSDGYRRLMAALEHSQAAQNGKLNFMKPDQLHFTIVGGLQNRVSVSQTEQQLADAVRETIADHAPVPVRVRGLWNAKDISARAFLKNYPAMEGDSDITQLSAMKIALHGSDDKVYASALYQLLENLTPEEAEDLARIHAQFADEVLFEYPITSLQLIRFENSMLKNLHVVRDIPLGRTQTTRTRHAYDRIAGMYGKMWQNVINPEVLRHLTRFLSLLPRGIVLEAGTGSGQKLNWFQEQGRNVIGIDLSANMLQVARDKFPALEGRLIQADLTQWPIQRSSVAGIWDDGAFHHIPAENAAQVMGSYYEGLKPGGVLFVLVKKGSGHYVQQDPQFGGVRHFERYTPEQIAKLASSVGFNILEANTQVKNNADGQSSGEEWVFLFAQKPGRLALGWKAFEASRIGQRFIHFFVRPIFTNVHYLSNEPIGIFDDQNRPIGVMGLDEAHRAHQWHRTSFVIPFNRRNGKLLIQRRGNDGRYDTIGGHNPADKTESQTAAIEASEELFEIEEHRLIQMEFNGWFVNDCPPNGERRNREFRSGYLVALTENEIQERIERSRESLYAYWHSSLPLRKLQTEFEAIRRARSAGQSWLRIGPSARQHHRDEVELFFRESQGYEWMTLDEIAAIAKRHPEKIADGLMSLLNESEQGKQATQALQKALDRETDPPAKTLDASSRVGSPIHPMPNWLTFFWPRSARQTNPKTKVAA